MSESSPPSKPVRPFSLKAEDFLEGAPQELRDRATRESAQPDIPETPPPPSYRDPDEAPSGAAGRASTQSRRPQLPSDKPKPKDEHTILMAVPPPAQENDGNK